MTISPKQENTDQAVSETTDPLEKLRWHKFPVLDDGFVCLVDSMGDDSAVVQAARVSYGDGTKKVSSDRGLIRYLMRHRHTTPFEMAEIKLLVRVPMDCWRQWIRHRTACLAGDVELHFDSPAAEPSAGHESQESRHVPIAEFYQHWLTERAQLSRLKLRMCNEQTGDIEHTYVTDVWESGVKPVYRVTLENGSHIKMTASHRCLTTDGWKTLEQATQLRRLSSGCHWNGNAPAFAVAPAFTVDSTRIERDNDWTAEQTRQELTHEHGSGTSCDTVGSSTAMLMTNKSQANAVREWSRVVRIEYTGDEMTYDLSVGGPYHNFVANGFVVHNSVNEYSTRYSLAIDSAQQTLPGEWRLQSEANRQGSAAPLTVELGQQLSEQEAELHQSIRDTYQQRIDLGVAREQARKDLPLATYTEAYWKCDLHNLLHFLALRMDSHAQWEIQQFARTIGEQIVKPLFPLVWEAFEDYRLQAMYLTRLDIETIARLQQRLAEQGRGQASIDDLEVCQPAEWQGLTRCRERDELQSKLDRLGMWQADAA